MGDLGFWGNFTKFKNEVFKYRCLIRATKNFKISLIDFYI